MSPLTEQTKHRGRTRVSPLLVVVTSIALTIAMAPTAAAVTVDPADLTGTGLSVTGHESGTKSPTSRLAKSDPTVLAATGSNKVSLLVKLDYDSVATYNGGIEGLQATSPSATNRKLAENADAVNRYNSYVAGVEGKFTAALGTAIPDAKVGMRLRTVYGGLALSIPAGRAKDLAKLPGVVAVQADHLNQPLTDSSPEFIGAPTLYSALGSDTTAGKGAIVADIDSGVWPEHPSFAPNPAIGNPPPKSDGTARTCDYGDNPLTIGVDVFQCNNKLISGEPFLATYNAAVGGEVYPDSARDSDGHGTHTASTAAGGPVASAKIFGIERGPLHGIAPGAHIAAYKVCGLTGCFTSDSAAAVAQAITDGVDVINFSISGGANPFSDVVELAFLDAYAAGVFVSASAGNSGPGAGTTAHHGPWVMTVAASTQSRAFQSTLTVTSDTDTFTATGASITPGVSASTPVVLATAAPYNRVLCDAPAPAGVFTGKIVVCQRGGNGRMEKGYNVKQGGAAGMILYNPQLADVETDNHFLPTVHLADGTDFIDFMRDHPTATATFTAGAKGTGKGDVMAAFSSRGPGGNWLKPDVTAPGVEILAGNTPTPDALASGPAGEYFQAIAGTSMSAPHVAGAAALLVSLHPTWTPGQIKSALMTTAKTTVVKEDETTPADPFDFGSGRIDLTKAGDPGLTFDVDAADYAAASDDVRNGVDLNLPSVNVPVLPGDIVTTRVAKNVTDHRMTYRATASAPSGTRIVVSPSRFTLRPNQSVTLKIAIYAAQLPIGKQAFGKIVLDEVGGRHDLHLPVAFVHEQGPVSLTAQCLPASITLRPRTESTCSVSATNKSTSPTTVDITSQPIDRLRVTSVTGATRNGLGGVKLNASLPGEQFGVPAIAPGPSPAGYLPLDAFGITPTPVGDEDMLNLKVPAFVYAGKTYTAMGVTSNGYLVAGGGTSADVQFEPQTLPDPTPPNNLLAPFWTDLDGTGAPGVFAGSLTDGVDSWIVVEWRVNVFGTGSLRVFQAWIGTNGTEDVSFTYDPANLPGDPNTQRLTVGAENLNGSGGAQITGLPTQDLRVTSTPGAPGGTASYQFKVAGTRTGGGSILTAMTSPAVGGRTLVVSTVGVR